jgi:hypothetical protein
MAVVQQLLWSPHYPKTVVVPDAVHLNFPLAKRLNHRCAVRSFEHLRFQHHIFFAAAAAL